MLLLLFSFSLPFLSEEFLPQSMGSTLLFVFFFFPILFHIQLGGGNEQTTVSRLNHSNTTGRN